MEVHTPTNAPDHVHGCPVHVGGTPAASVNGLGQKVSDACFWDEHTPAFKLANRAKYDAAVALKGL